MISLVAVAAGVNLGYSLTWIIGYLANRPDLQQNGFEAIQQVYNGEPPQPHEFDRVAYIKALHTVRKPDSPLILTVTNSKKLHRKAPGSLHPFVSASPARPWMVPATGATRFRKTR
jgi:hypothetical protein